MKKSTICCLSANALKIIAAISMLIDHIGYILFPQIKILRIIGRIAFPIFAYMIAEGTRYTKDRQRYFLNIFVLAILFVVAYYFVIGKIYMNILMTFSYSILIIYALQGFKEALFKKEKRNSILSFVILISTIAMVFILNKIRGVDYGFYGVMVPVFASVFQDRKSDIKTPSWFARFDKTPVHILMLTIGLLILSYKLKWVQIYSLFAIPLLLLYSGERGKLNMKYFFYIFYPLHLVILQGINMMMK